MNAKTEETSQTEESGTTEKKAEKKADKSQQEKKDKKSAFADRKDNKKGDFRGGFRRDSNPDVIYGRDFEGEPVALETITGEMGEVIVRGQVMDVEAREIRNEKTILIFPITDFTDSIVVKMFLRNEQVPEVTEHVKKGAFLKFRGVTTVDRFDSELTIASIAGIKKIANFTTARVDTTPQKRVELHCHTKMSDMDGVTDAKSLVKRAYEWGHPAIAITDHGVVQAFPEAKKIDAVITVQITVKANQLHLNVTKIKNNLSEGIPEGNGVEENAIQTLSFPNQSLVSVRSSQENAQFTGARMSSNTQKPGDTNFAVTEDTNVTDSDYTYGFISGAGLSAGLWSNSEHDGTYVAAPVRGGSQNTRVYATTQQTGDATSLGLASAPWYYHRTVTDSKGKKYTVAETALPQMAVAIAGDENEDGAVNWQDGAIAYRDIMNNPYKSEEVPELVAWRIAMNFGSQAQNPFLTTLDNVKKVALNTDGLGQAPTAFPTPRGKVTTVMKATTPATRTTAISASVSAAPTT